MRILITGAAGMLARDLLPALQAAGHDVVGVGREVDVRDAGAVREAVVGGGVEVVVNAAAWTAVDHAESREGEAYDVNATGAGNLAAACTEAGASMVQISTDYVFAGDADTPYDVSHLLAPRGAYGRTKAAGEYAVRALCPRSWIVRTAWLYGAGGPNFVSTMARLAGERDTVDVVSDQIGQPTWTVELAAAIVRLLGAQAPYGIYHGTCAGQTSWYGLAQEVFAGLGLDPERVRPTTSAAFARPARRPAWSVLDHACWGKVGLEAPAEWRQVLRTALPLVVAQR